MRERYPIKGYKVKLWSDKQVDFSDSFAYNTPIGGRLMSLPSVTEIIPLEADSSGVVRVGKTRVTLDVKIIVYVC